MEVSQTQLVEVIQAQFSSIVPELRDFITSTELDQALTGMCESYEVPDAIDRVHNDVTLILLGIASLEDFNTRLGEETGLSAEDADRMATDILTITLADVLGYVPQTLSPEAQALADEYITEPPKESPILQATRTMQGDVAEAQGDSPKWRTLDEDEGPQETSGVESATESGDVPRYAKPLTDTPKYE